MSVHKDTGVKVGSAAVEMATAEGAADALALNDSVLMRRRVRIAPYKAGSATQEPADAGAYQGERPPRRPHHTPCHSRGTEVAVTVVR